MADALPRQTMAWAARGAPMQLPHKQKIPKEPEGDSEQCHSGQAECEAHAVHDSGMRSSASPRPPHHFVNHSFGVHQILALVKHRDHRCDHVFNSSTVHAVELTEAKITTAAPAEKAQLQRRAEVLREWITPKATMPISI